VPQYFPYVSRLIMSTGKLTACCDISGMSSISGVCVQLLNSKLCHLCAEYVSVLFLKIT